MLPQAFWFRLLAACPRIEGIPRASSKRMFDLPSVCRIPQTSLLDGAEPWAEIRAAWNPQGLAIAVNATGKLERLIGEEKPAGLYGVQVWIDTRDTRDVSRATRFCHRFDAKLDEGSGKRTLGVKVQQRPIARAIADAPLCRPEAILARASRSSTSWTMELFFSSEALNGFDPETNRRLGFAYQITDPHRVDEFFGVGREFPVGENPSLWSTLELIDTP
ncbi:MAG: hypothetical protein NVSMB9_11570 [Isosphaeraceae bacterium]